MTNYKCPECANNMVWQSDWDTEEDDAIITMWTCSECEIDLTKRIPLTS